MADLKLVRWRKFGMDRLYVNTTDGSRVGWVDLVTGTETVELEQHRAEFRRVVQEYNSQAEAGLSGIDPPFETSAQAKPQESDMAAEDAEVVPSAQRDTSVPTSPKLSGMPWTDLSWNVPGEGVRAQAVALQRAAPVRTWIARARKQHTPERAWRLGAQGETAVGGQLMKLSSAWRFLHSVPVGERGSDIDHVAIGPGGVYTINAKNHPDAKVSVLGNRVVVNGAATWHVRNARFEAERASRILTEVAGFDVFVTGLVVIVGAAGGFEVKRQPPGGSVHVLVRKSLAEWLRRRGESLNDDQIASLFAVGRRSSTWV